MNDRSTLETLEWFTDTLRRYAPDPLAESDDEYRRFRRQCARDADFREQLGEDEARELDPRSDEEWFMDEQCPSDSTFR